MAFYDFNHDFQVIEGFNRRRKQVEAEFEAHRRSGECTGKEDCPKCKDFLTEIRLCDPNLP